MAAHELRIEPQAGELRPVIDWIQACCAADGLADDIALKMMLAVEEAVTNVINHAFADLPPPHLITVRLEIDGDSVAAEVADNGREFDPTAAPDPDLSLPLERRRPGGLGIHLMRRIMDSIAYRRSDGRNILRMVKKVPPTPLSAGTPGRDR